LHSLSLALSSDFVDPPTSTSTLNLLLSPTKKNGKNGGKTPSTLDPVLRMETRSVALPQLLALAGAVTAYLTVRPGVAAGAIDFYILDRASRAMRRRVGPSDVEVGDKMAQGGFGSVYRATLLGEGEKEKTGAKKGGGSKASSSSSSPSSPPPPPSTSTSTSSSSRPVILKIATEFGPAEAWMNERLARAAPWAVADFITAFDETTEDDIDDDDEGGGANGANGARKKQKKTKARSAADGGPLWLLWEDEGPETATLSQLMNRRDWPYCAEPLLFGRELRLPRGPRRRGAVVKEVARQLLSALDALHAVGIVHRDVKPQNVIVSQRARRVKLIDLGAAADLRVGVNYSPNLSLLDPR
jgi:serine/threonine protein kinase